MKWDFWCYFKWWFFILSFSQISQLNNLSSECTFKWALMIPVCQNLLVQWGHWNYPGSWTVLMWHLHLRIFLQRLHLIGPKAAFKWILFACCFREFSEMDNFMQSSQTYLSVWEQKSTKAIFKQWVELNYNTDWEKVKM